MTKLGDAELLALLEQGAGAFFSPLEYGRRVRDAAYAQAAEVVQAQSAALKARADGPGRDDWQLGYAAACRELRDAIPRAIRHLTTQHKE